MARFGEIACVDPYTGRAFGDLLSYTHWSGFDRGYARLELTPPSTLSEISDETAIEAHISRDEWVVDCPDCPGADNVFEKDMLLWCHFCGNVRVGGKWRRVCLPGEWPAIEELLNQRIGRDRRMWKRPTTVPDLILENDELGVES